MVLSSIQLLPTRTEINFDNDDTKIIMNVKLLFLYQSRKILTDLKNDDKTCQVFGPLLSVK